MFILLLDKGLIKAEHGNREKNINSHLKPPYNYLIMSNSVMLTLTL